MRSFLHVPTYLIQEEVCKYFEQINKNKINWLDLGDEPKKAEKILHVSYFPEKGILRIRKKAFLRILLNS